MIPMSKQHRGNTGKKREADEFVDIEFGICGIQLQRVGQEAVAQRKCANDHRTTCDGQCILNLGSLSAISFMLIEYCLFNHTSAEVAEIVQ